MSKIELKVLQQFDHFNDTTYFVVKEMECGTEIHDGQLTKLEAVKLLVQSIAEKPDLYFADQSLTLKNMSKDQMHLTEKDFKALTCKPNSVIDGMAVARARLENMPDSILNWYEENQNLITADVVVVRGKEDESKAACARNSGKNTLFVFSDKYYVTSYFSGTTKLITFSKALLKRAA